MLSECEKKELIQYNYILQMEMLCDLDDFYKKQKVGIRVCLGDKHKLSLPAIEMREVQNRALSEFRLTNKKRK